MEVGGCQSAGQPGEGGGGGGAHRGAGGGGAGAGQGPTGCNPGGGGAGQVRPDIIVMKKNFFPCSKGTFVGKLF